MYYSQDAIKQSVNLKYLRLYPEMLQSQLNTLLQKEILETDIYQAEISTAIDSMIRIRKLHVKLLDTIFYAHYLRKKELLSQSKGIRIDLAKFINGNELLFKQLLERGSLTTGKAGEWNRQGDFIENYFSVMKNPVLLKSWIDIRKHEFKYCLLHDPISFEELSKSATLLKSNLASKEPDLTRFVSEGDRLRSDAEIEKYLELAFSVRGKDKSIGIGTNQGLIGNQLFQLAIISEKCNLLSQSLEKQLNRFIFNQFLLRIFTLLLLTVIVLYFISSCYRNIQRSIYGIINYLQELVKGKLPEPITLESKDELKRISELIGEFVLSIRGKVKFAQHLGKGTNNQELVPLSKDDTLANALLELQVSLKKASEEDAKYKIEEKKRAWSNEGLAKFIEILRYQTTSIDELSDLIIKNLVKYLNANQGGIFAYFDDVPEDQHLELVSAFAFDRKKHLQKRVEIGEGLVGTCAQEKLTIYMTDIPAEYISITSGLGEATPRSLLIIPLKTEDAIYGILEIASFNILEPHEIEFVEKLAESIASTFASLKINVHTSKLLEQSKKQAEEMAQQEEEMRQNLEELQATQEESDRREAEILSIVGAIDLSSMVMELDMDGKIIEINKKYCSVINCHKEDLFGKNLRAICYFDPQTDDYNYLLSELRNGRSMVREEEVHFNNKQYYFTQNYSPIFDKDRNPYKILLIASNNSDKIHLSTNLTELNTKLVSSENQLNSLNNVLDKALMVAELSPDATIINANKNYLEVTGYLQNEVLEKNARFFLKAEELRQFELIWAEVEKGKIHQGVVRRTKPTGEEYWLMSAAIPVTDNNGQILKVYFIAQDITEKKLKYQVLEEANKEIERLKNLYEKNNKEQI